MGISVWALTGGRRGDDAQVVALAEAVGDMAVKPLTFRAAYGIPNLLLGATLSTLDPAARNAFRAPWPDVAIGVGRRSVPVARWIREKSGGRTKLVAIGRPRAPLHWFDLVLTPPQYGLPDAPNVVKLLLPPIRNRAPSESVVEAFRERVKGLPRPWIGLLVGGSRAPYRLDQRSAAELGRQAVRAAQAAGGTLLVSTSPRTGEVAAEALRAALSGPFEMQPWSSRGTPEHQAVLALADRFIVTGESVSMIAEACLTGKPVEVHPLPRMPLPRWNAAQGAGRWLAANGVLSPPRDPEKAIAILAANGHVAPLNQTASRSFMAVPDELSRAADAVRRLVDAAAG